MKNLTAVHSLPYCTTNGRVVSRVGWDQETGIYLHLPFDVQVDVAESPSREEVAAAVRQLVAPLRAYTWASPDDAAAAMCSVLTAVARPVLDICPAVLIDAASPGSGKTRLATALASLMTARYEGVLPFSGINEEELRKQIISSVLCGQRAMILDNLYGHFNSSTLAAVLTSGRLKGRVLGLSRDVDAIIRALFLMTSNNASLGADLSRRTMRVRIESGANPTHRRFDFDPVAEALRDRLRIAEAACSIWQAYFAAGAPRLADDDAGGFSSWSNLCRQPVLWIAREGLARPVGWELGDPAALMLADPVGSDPEIEALGDLLRALHALSGGLAFTAAEMLIWFRAGEGSDEADACGLLHGAVCDILTLGKGQVPSTRSLGRLLLNRRDRVVGGPEGGLKLMTRDDRGSNVRHWKVAHSVYSV